MSRLKPESGIKTESRRNTLKALFSTAGLTAGAHALPERWLKPVVSSILLPAHAQTSPSESTPSFPAFECTVTSSDVELVQPEVFIYILQVATEAADSTPVRFILRDPGSAEFNSESDVVDDTTVTGGFASVESDFNAEFEGTVELDVDIGIDGEIDCSVNVSL